MGYETSSIGRVVLAMDQARAMVLKPGEDGYIDRPRSSGWSPETVEWTIRGLLTLNESTLPQLMQFLLMHEKEIANVTTGFETLYVLRPVFVDIIGREPKE